MNLIELQRSLRERVRAAAEKFGVELEQVPSEVPPRTELGDLAFPVAFELAKRIKQATGEKRNPRAIAEEVKQVLEADEAGLADAVEKLEDVEGIATLRFSTAEVVRHPIVGRIVEAYDGPLASGR